MILQDEFPELWHSIVTKEIPNDKIDEFLLKFHLEIINEIKLGNRTPWDAIILNDLWQIVISSGYKSNPEVEAYMLHLTEFDPDNPQHSYEISYIDAQNEPTYAGNLNDIEERAKELLYKLSGSRD